MKYSATYDEKKNKVTVSFKQIQITLDYGYARIEFEQAEALRFAAFLDAASRPDETYKFLHCVICRREWIVGKSPQKILKEAIPAICPKCRACYA